MRVTDLLRTMDIFDELPSEELEKIARLMREQRLSEGEVLCRQGDPGDAMYVVTGGTIRLATVEANGNERVLAYFRDGQFFGEAALLTDTPRSATATAETESRVLVLPKEDFNALVGTNATILREMLKVVSQRTVQTNQQLLSDDGGDASTQGAGRVFAIFSPRGGSGKSTLAVNLAVQFARELPNRVGLLDLDLVFGHCALLLNLAPQSSLAALPAEDLGSFDRQTLSQYVTEHDSGLRLLVGAARPEEGESVTGDHVRSTLAVMKRQFAVTVVDCGASFSDPVVAALESATKVVLVCTPDLNTLRDVRDCQRIFGEVLHLDKGKVFYLLNQFQPFKTLSKEQFEGPLESAIDLEIPHAGETAVKAALKGEPLVTFASGSPYAKSIQQLATALEPSLAAPAKGKAAGFPVAAGAAPPPPKPRGLRALFRRA